MIGYPAAGFCLLKHVKLEFCLPFSQQEHYQDPVFPYKCQFPPILSETTFQSKTEPTEMKAILGFEGRGIKS